MKKSKVAIISYYRWWSKRQKFFYEFYDNKGYDVEYYVSSYNHITKNFDNIDIPKVANIVSVSGYKNNLSLGRVISNIIFSLKVRKIIKVSNPEIIVILVPSNLLGFVTKNFSKKHKNTKIIVDILDLWPESFPISNKKKKLAGLLFYFWKKFRKMAIESADLVLLECNYYSRLLKNDLINKDFQVLYLQKSNGISVIDKRIDDEINFIYLGSINHIIDIEKMVKILSKINKARKVSIDIIGTGINEKKFINLLKENKITYKFWGPIFDEEKKIKIIQKAHFGLNIMKNTVSVGLTTKSIEYFESNIPIINSIPYDTEYFIDYYQAGFNIINEDISKVSNDIINLDSNKYMKLSRGVNKLFVEQFSTNTFENKLKNILEKI